MNAIKTFLMVFVALLCAAESRVLGGELLYSIDNETDELVRIDSESGNVIVVGPIGHDMNRVAMTYFDSVLYAVTSNEPSVFANAGFTLVTIDPQSGGKLASVPVTAGGGDVSVIESLTTLNGGLIVGFDVGALTSKRTGDLNPLTGVVTNASPRGPDLDAMATYQGSIVAVDSINFSGNRKQLAFYDVDRDPPTFTFIGDYVDTDSVIDLAFAADTLYGLDFFSKSLLTLSPSPGQKKLSELPLGLPGQNLSGLAAVPEPTTLTLTVLGLFGLVARRRRRRARSS